MPALLLALLLPAAAGADVRVRIDATVDPDLRTVSGTMAVVADGPVHLVDPLAALPVPTADEVVQATFPGAPDRGRAWWSGGADGTWTFRFTLPRRYGDIGATRHFGLMGNGGWYPQPMTPDGLPVADWEVTVHLPEGATGALGDRVGADVLTWTGRGERASLAVVPHAVVTPLVAGGARVMLVTRGPPRPGLARSLGSELDGVVPSAGPRTGVVVEAPVRRRLVRPGVRLTYVSDRAWRLTPGFRRFHHVAVMRGVASALLDVPDPFARDLAASTLAARYGDVVGGASAAESLKWVAWVPLVDRMLSSRRTPFISEILEEALPGDPLADDLVEVLDPHWPASAVVAQVDDAWGAGTADRLGRALEAGRSVAEAAAEAGVDPAWLESLRAPLPVQDYRLEVDRAAGEVRVTRDAAEGAPAEVMLVVVDDAATPWRAGPGPDALTLPATPRRVALDPERHVAQTSIVGDTWPARYTPVVTAWFSRLDLRQLYLDGFAQLGLRRQYDTRWNARLRVYTDEQTLVGGELAYTRQFGRELDGLRRLHQVEAVVSPAVLSARYAPLEDGRVVLGGALGWAWDDRVADYFPLHGHRLELGVDAGFTPGGTDAWRAVRAKGLYIASPHPRFAFPLEVLAGVAGGTVPHRLVDLGGLDGMRSLPPGDLIGTSRLIGRAEGRWAFLHNASLPAVVAWGDELSVSAGVEAGVARAQGRPVAAIGATVGVGWQVALLGATPSFARLRVGVPLWRQGFVPADGVGPQVVLETEKLF